MKAVVLPGDETAAVQTLPDPTPGPGEVLIKVRASAICGSDMSAYRGDPVVKARSGGIVPGHEIAGEIAELGAGVTGLAVGDRVAVYLAVGCMRCEFCRRGYLMLCPEGKIIGFELAGGDAEYVTVPAINCMPIPEGMSMAQAAVSTDMFGTQFSAQDRLGVSATDSVVVFGLGPMGAAAVAIAKGHGAHVIAVDPVETRQELGRRLGADTVVGSDDGALRKAIKGAGGADVAIECSGNRVAFETALDVVVPFGRVAIVGEGREATLNPSAHLLRKLTTVIGAWYFPIWQFEALTGFLQRHEIATDSIVSHRLGIDDAPEAFEMLAAKTSEKMVFEF
ncbi:MAG: putative zinc-type alcohol dehydrogenase-like protein YdjJ [Conexibacter sp.]|jgi:threonine dehydrogenase-like Zn-dependent dehydrogenase|nr:putative zinc-type alcohol dehydrogenase-like protein YdjJ [Conexibacter sp.]